jgi:hypothetical protein
MNRVNLVVIVGCHLLARVHSALVLMNYFLRLVVATYYQGTVQQIMVSVQILVALAMLMVAIVRLQIY